MTRTIRMKQGFITSTSLGAVAVACSLGLPGAVATMGLLAVSSPGHAQEAVSDAAYYGVSTFQLRLIPGDHPGLPSAEQLLRQATVALFETSGGWTSSAPIGDVAPTSTSVAALPSGNYSRGALQTIAESILGAVTADGIVGATVVIDSTMIGNDGSMVTVFRTISKVAPTDLVLCGRSHTRRAPFWFAPRWYTTLGDSDLC